VSSNDVSESGSDASLPSSTCGHGPTQDGHCNLQGEVLSNEYCDSEVNAVGSLPCLAGGTETTAQIEKEVKFDGAEIEDIERRLHNLKHCGMTKTYSSTTNSLLDEADYVDHVNRYSQPVF
jgi:hypothetical protein